LNRYSIFLWPKKRYCFPRYHVDLFAPTPGWSGGENTADQS
jgi:hypothetical protein